MSTHKNKIILAICESKKQVEFLISQPLLYPDIDRWIAASSSAADFMSEMGISFDFIEDYQSDISMEGIELLQSEQTKWADKVDTYIQKNIQECNQINFQPARFALYFLKNAWDTHIHRADLLEQIRRNISFDEVIYFQNAHPVSYTSNLSLKGSALSESISLWADYYGIKTIPLDALPQDRFWETQVHMRNDPLRLIGKLPGYINSKLQEKLFLLKYKLFSESSPISLKSLKSAKNNLLIREKYDLNKTIINSLNNKGIVCNPFDAVISLSRKYYNQSPDITDKLAEEWDAIIRYDWFWQPEGWQNWSVEKILEPLFKKFWFGIIPILWNGMNASMNILQNLNPQAICVSIIYSNDQAELGFIMAAHEKKIPVIMYQHGACMGDIENNVWDLTDALYSNYSLVYGIGEKNYLEARSIIHSLNTIPVTVGSTRLDSLSSGISEKKIKKIRNKIVGKNNKPFVLYVPGMNMVNFFRYDYVNENYNNTFDIRKSIASFFSGQNNVNFIYKAFLSSGEDPTPQMLKKLCPDCIIVNDIPLTELLWAADLIIYEVPSTGMYEGLISNKPMIVYIDQCAYNMSESAKKMLEKRAVVSENGEEFISDVKEYVNEGNFSPVNEPDHEFLKTFCTHIDDGRSSERATDTILSILNKNIDE